MGLHFAECPDPQRVPQDVGADLHPPVVFLLLGCCHLSPGTESAHAKAVLSLKQTREGDTEISHKSFTPHSSIIPPPIINY